MVSWLQRPPASMANKIAVEVVIAEFWACAFFRKPGLLDRRPGIAPCSGRGSKIFI